MKYGIIQTDCRFKVRVYLSELTDGLVSSMAKVIKYKNKGTQVLDTHFITHININIVKFEEFLAFTHSLSHMPLQPWIHQI